MAEDDPITAMIRELLPTTLGSGEIRGQIAAEIRARSVFVSRVSSTVYLSEVRRVVELMETGDIGEADARVAILEMAKALGYTPEGGFPTDAPGAVPPAVRGTLQDLTSFRRIDLIVRTQIDLVRGRGDQMRGQDPDRLRAAPAWELIRVIPVREPRRWGGNYDGTPAQRPGGVDQRSRWVIAGGTVRPDGRLIAFKGDPVWGELGSSDNFSDALDVDFPPFAFNSGMRWEEVLRSEVLALDVRGPRGETAAEWEARERPRVMAGDLPLPGRPLSLPETPVSVREVPEDLREALDDVAEPVPDAPDKVRPAGAGDRIAERLAEIERRQAEIRLERAAKKRREEATTP